MITQKYLHEALSYDQETGVFTWLDDRPVSHFKNEHGRSIWKARRAGKPAGYKGNRGYIQIGIYGKLISAHRLAWCYVYGNMPDDQIDHIDGDPINNQISNIRAVTNAENSKNQKRYKNNSSGVVGVYWDKRGEKWMSKIKVDGNQIYLGLFDKIEDAAAARKSAELEYGFHENHGQDRAL
jgi:hypothetical protein